MKRSNALLLSVIFFSCIFLQKLAVNHPIHAESNSILINEVLYDPPGADSGNEWVEILNISDQPVDITGYQIQIAGQYFLTKVILPSYIIQPGEIILIGEKLVPNADITVNSLSLQNGGSETDGIRLLNSVGSPIDTLLYDIPNTNGLKDDTASISPSPAEDVSEGYSLARVSSIDTDNCFVDFIATDTPTPGNPNTFPPVADISAPETAYTSSLITFDGGESYDPDGTALSYTWELKLPDNTTKTASGPSFTTTCTIVGSYQITLTVTDKDYLSSSTSMTIDISEDPDNPTITPIADALLLEDGETVSIRGTVTASLLSLYEYETYVQDRSAGIRIKLPYELSVTKGKTYTITGTRDTTYGEPRLRVEAIADGDGTIDIQPQTISLTDISSNVRGTLITTTITIGQKRDSYLLPAEDTSAIVPVYFSKYLDPDLPEKTAGLTYVVTGIVSQYGTTKEGTPKLRIMPRSEEEIILQDTTQETAEISNNGGSVKGALATTGFSVMPPVLFGSICTALLLARIKPRQH